LIPVRHPVSCSSFRTVHELGKGIQLRETLISRLNRKVVEPAVVVMILKGSAPFCKRETARIFDHRDGGCQCRHLEQGLEMTWRKSGKNLARSSCGLGPPPNCPKPLNHQIHCKDSEPSHLGRCRQSHHDMFCFVDTCTSIIPYLHSLDMTTSG
jgi:hypothetical protein